MKNDFFQKLVYKLVSEIFVFPIYKFIFKGHLIGKQNIPQNDSFIMVSNHGSFLIRLVRTCYWSKYILWLSQNFSIYPSVLLLSHVGLIQLREALLIRILLKLPAKNFQIICIGIFIDGTRQKWTCK